MVINASLTDIRYTLDGQLTERHRFFFFRGVPVSIDASDVGVTFTFPNNKHPPKVVPYEELRSASMSNLLWKKKIILYAAAGIETIQCSGSREWISEFCTFINTRVAARKKPFAARFQLTQLEIPSEHNTQPLEHGPEEYQSAVDLLFSPTTELRDDILDRLESQISLSAPEVPLRQTPKTKRPFRPDRNDSYRNHNLFNNKYVPVWNLYVSKTHIRTMLLVLSIIMLGGVAAWQFGRLPSMEPRSLTSITTESPAIPPEPVSIPPPRQRKSEAQPRALMQLVEIMQNDEKYLRLIDTLKQSRMRTGVSTNDASARLEWHQSKLEDMESKRFRATAIDIIDYTLAIRHDIHEILEGIK